LIDKGGGYWVEVRNTAMPQCGASGGMSGQRQERWPVAMGR
jgi:hypothetical protein